ncbi:MAG: hypothetical protein AAB967_00935, partial [Patescibacteria group bacterium]
TVVRKEEVEAFLEPLPIRKIPGIGPKAEILFLKKGIRLVRDLKKISREEMKKMLGKWGEDLYTKIRGQDESPVGNDAEIKSIGEQETFSHDTRDSLFLTERLAQLCQSVIARFTTSGFLSFKTVVLTVRFADFETKSRSRTLETPVGSFAALQGEGMRLLLPFLDARENPKKKLIRLLGVRVEKLNPAPRL